jgi:transcriptional regulator with XRE-family HTH domain
MSESENNLLGTYLRDRRARLDPAAFGFSSARRRTPGLRREEVAQRANVSATWYTWLEQGRGGAPSADVLDRIARALTLTAAEREHLFLLAQGRPPEVREDPQEQIEAVSPTLQRILDSMTLSPAYVKTSTWDVVAWNRAAVAVFGNYGELPPADRNIMKVIFNPVRQKTMPNWESVARFMVATMRADSARAGMTKRAEQLAVEMIRLNPTFETMWNEKDVRTHGEGTKQISRPDVGVVSMDYSAFAVDGRPNLSMVIYTPTAQADAERIHTLIKQL